MKYIVASLALLLVVFGFLLIKSGRLVSSSVNTRADQSELKEPQGADCGKGVEGNNGDNFCANYHGGGSKCLGEGLPNTYNDGCTLHQSPN